MVKIEVLIHEKALEMLTTKAADSLAVWLHNNNDGTFTLANFAPTDWEAVEELRSFYEPESTLPRTLPTKEEWEAYRDAMINAGRLKPAENAPE